MTERELQTVEPAAWFRAELEEGINNLCRLNLHGKPRDAAERTRAVEAFAEQLWPGSAWIEYRDAPRLRSAFRGLGNRPANDAGYHPFPGPGDLLQEMPRFEVESRPVELVRLEQGREAARFLKPGEQPAAPPVAPPDGQGNGPRSPAEVKRMLQGLDPFSTDALALELKRRNTLRKAMGKRPHTRATLLKALEREEKERGEQALAKLERRPTTRETG